MAPAIFVPMDCMPFWVNDMQDFYDKAPTLLGPPKKYHLEHFRFRITRPLHLDSTCMAVQNLVTECGYFGIHKSSKPDEIFFPANQFIKNVTLKIEPGDVTMLHYGSAVHDRFDVRNLREMYTLVEMIHNKSIRAWNRYRAHMKAQRVRRRRDRAAADSVAASMHEMMLT